MTTSARSDRINGIVSQLKLSVWWTLLASIYFGWEVADVMWKPHDDFYPFPILMWGALTVISFWGSPGALVQLTYAVEFAEAETTRMKTRSVLVAIFGAACISFCWAVCVVASKLFGRLYLAAAVVLGVLLLFIGFLMYRWISHRIFYFTSCQKWLRVRG
jgi:hypothetical protein